jgi:ParB family chromosome partitioning protein
MSKKRALGKGLSALLEHAETDITMPASNGSVLEKDVLGSVSKIKIADIEANPFQPRTEFEKEPLIELSKSIAEHGIIQPLTVRKMGRGQYQIISGERRFRASQLAGLEEVPCYIRLADDQTMLEMALVENIQREDLNAVEIGISYQRLIEECSLTQEELSQKVGKNRSTISNYLRLLKLPPLVQSGLQAKKISMGHARALITIGDDKKIEKIYKQILEEGLSVRAVEQIAKGKNTAAPAEAVAKTGRPALSFEQQRFKSGLSRLVEAKVGLKQGNNGSGTIVIPFENDDDLRRIAHALDI